MQKHYLKYLTDVMSHQWSDAALTDYGEDHEYSFGELAIEMLRLHLLFDTIGLQRGAKIALCGRNCANWAVAYLAIAAYEGVCVSILQDFKAEDISHLLEHSDAEMLFVGPYVWKDLQHQALPSKLKVVLSLEDWRSLYVAEGVNMPDEKALTALFNAKYPQGIEPEDVHFSADPDALALINYTSGSTGSPKGVMLNGRSISNNVEVGMKMLPVDPGQRLVSMLPLAHMFGQVCELLYPLSSGTHIYFLTKSPTPSILLKALKDVQPYLVVTVPLVIEKIYKKDLDPMLSKWAIRTLWHMPILGDILKRHVKSSLKKALGGHLRYFICGGAAMNPIVEKCLMDIHFPLSIGYGMTECGPLIGGNPPKYFKARSGGVPVTNMEVRIDQPNAEGIGEIEVKGENVMLGYYKNPEATADAFDNDGFFRTGDYGRLDDEGWIYITGRKKNLIILSNGENVYPEEIEEEILKVEGVSEVVVYAGESRIQKGKDIIVAEIYPDSDTLAAKGVSDPQSYFEQQIKLINASMPAFKAVKRVKLRDTEFQKNTSRKIVRYTIDKTLD